MVSLRRAGSVGRSGLRVSLVRASEYESEEPLATLSNRGFL
jgi:hypothetical protein